MSIKELIELLQEQAKIVGYDADVMMWDDDIVNADRIRVAYTDTKGDRKYMYIALSDDKTISHDNAKKFIESFASRFSIESPLTANLNTQR